MTYLNVTAAGLLEGTGANLLIGVTNQEGQPVQNLLQESFSVWGVGIEPTHSLPLIPLEIVIFNRGIFDAPGEPFYRLQVRGNDAYSIFGGGTGNGLLAVTVI